jgi:hypothetical protein
MAAKKLKRPHSSDTIYDDLITIVGQKVMQMTQLTDLQIEDIDSLDKLHRIWTSLRREERELSREAALDQIAASDLEQYKPLIIDYLSKKSDK